MEVVCRGNFNLVIVRVDVPTEEARKALGDVREVKPYLRYVKDPSAVDPNKPPSPVASRKSK